jgi:hypothetical protein
MSDLHTVTDEELFAEMTNVTKQLGSGPAFLRTWDRLATQGLYDIALLGDLCAAIAPVEKRSQELRKELRKRMRLYGRAPGGICRNRSSLGGDIPRGG